MPSNTIQPAIEERAAQPAVFIPITVTLSQWGEANALVPELFAWIGERGIVPAGAPFYRYLILDDDSPTGDTPYSLEIGIPVAEGVQGDDRVQTGTIPAGTYLSYIHHGHPDELFEVNTAILSWAEREGIHLAASQEDGTTVWHGRYEFFLTNPEVEPDLNKWKTEVVFLTTGAQTEADRASTGDASP